MKMKTIWHGREENEAKDHLGMEQWLCATVVEGGVAGVVVTFGPVVGGEVVVTFDPVVGGEVVVTFGPVVGG